jgi:hypothetical protein
MFFFQTGHRLAFSYVKMINNLDSTGNGVVHHITIPLTQTTLTHGNRYAFTGITAKIFTVS